jgi:peptidoglycan-N-acetylglucosamine deacetylase
MNRRRLWYVLAAVAAVTTVAAVLTAERGDDRAGSPTALSSTTSGVTTSTNETRPTSTTAASTSSTSTQATATTTSTVQTTTTTTPPAVPAVVVRHGAPTSDSVALTFDAGADLGHTDAILDTLRFNGIQATFGVTGRWAEEHPGAVARIAAEGHQILNHSYDHPSFTGRSTDAPPLSRDERLEQLRRADAAIQSAAGVSTKPWFRPPYGDEDESVRRDVALAGYSYEVMWSVDSLGWQGLAAQEITARCLDRAEPGAIYLFHVGNASADHAALQAIIDGLRGRQLRFVTVADLVLS